MTPGKKASQAGHAFLDSFLRSSTEQRDSYIADGGTKIVLSVATERELCALYYEARMSSLPCAMVIESEHVMPPDFDGSPIVTAVGIGPIRRSLAKRIIGSLRLLS